MLTAPGFVPPGRPPTRIPDPCRKNDESSARCTASCTLPLPAGRRKISGPLSRTLPVSRRTQISARPHKHGIRAAPANTASGLPPPRTQTPESAVAGAENFRARGNGRDAHSSACTVLAPVNASHRPRVHATQTPPALPEAPVNAPPSLPAEPVQLRKKRGPRNLLRAETQHVRRRLLAVHHFHAPFRSHAVRCTTAALEASG